MNPILAGALRPLVQSLQISDEKLTRVVMHIMKLRAGAPEPVHPKNILHSRSPHTWFEPFLPRQGGKVLDLGAGTGSLSMLAARRGTEVVAIEGEPRNIRLLESLSSTLPAGARLAAIQHDLETFPYPIAQGDFDVVISHDVIEHLHKRQEHLAEAARALKTGGRLVIAAPNRNTTWKRVRGSLGLSMLADADHKIEYTREEFLAELSSAGFGKILHESATVIDAPISGILELSAPISLALYGRALGLKAWLAGKFPGETTGFRFVFEKTG